MLITAESLSANIEQLRETLDNNGLLVLPTDTVYGIASALTPGGVASLLGAKHRELLQPPPVLVADLNSAEVSFGRLPEFALSLAEYFWPGPLTLVIETSAKLPWPSGKDTPTGTTVALRQPDNDLALQLLSALGPLAVTSANLHGKDPATDCKRAMDYFGDTVSVYIDGGSTPGPVPSTIVSCVDRYPKILRQGALSASQVARVVQLEENS
ncbi:MAG: L-threonylcarbamoyladenylate synthase [Varibaculum sp.]|nr:L-threonylcarbamoyladenylate synthase [Varibaculum sp.]